jgi:Ca2+/Na+ antiporter
MTDAHKDKNSTLTPTDPRRRAPLPVGYRQGIISAITLIMGFSLLFLRYWNFEAPGVWSRASIAAAMLLVLAILVQFVTLWRSLQVKDDDEREYQQTLRWFLGSVVVLFASLFLAVLASSHVIGL